MSVFGWAIKKDFMNKEMWYYFSSCAHKKLRITANPHSHKLNSYFVYDSIINKLAITSNVSILTRVR